MGVRRDKRVPVKPSELLWSIRKLVPHQQPMTWIMQEKVALGRDDVNVSDSLSPRKPATYPPERGLMKSQARYKNPDQSLAWQPERSLFFLVTQPQELCEESGTRAAVFRFSAVVPERYLQVRVARAHTDGFTITERFTAEYKTTQKDTILHVMHLVFVGHRPCNSPSDVGRHGHGMVVGNTTHLRRPQVHWRTASIELIRRNVLLHAIRRPSWEATHHPRVVLRHIGRMHLPVHRSKLLLVGVRML